jgi:putative inorganic carbon (hco3(-)) transporter
MLKSIIGGRRLFQRGYRLTYTFILVFAILLGYLLATQLILGVGLFGAIVGLSVLVVCILSAEAGLYINMIFSYIICVVARAFFNDELKVGVLTGILIGATFLGLFFKGNDFKQNFNKFCRAPAGKGFLIYLLYMLIEVCNPYANFFVGWYDPFRSLLTSGFLILIAYDIFNDPKAIRRFLYVFFILTTLVAFYGCFQQWHGLFPFEIAWVNQYPLRHDLIFIAGDYRKYSTFTDPPGFGLMMAGSAAFFLVILAGQREIKYRLVILTGVVLMLLGMAYSGTRTANVMFISGLVMFILLTIHKRNTIIFAIFSAITLLALIFGPFYGNATIARFRSTFTGKNDESYAIREVNRKTIQPYMWAHPVGGGLGTTGLFSTLLNPGHPLAGFPTDSGYLKTALEMGWIGLIIRFLFYFAVIRDGIRVYFRSRNPKVKMVAAACISLLFSFFIAEFAQEAIGQFTDVVVLYPMIALILQIRNIEKDT